MKTTKQIKILQWLLLIRLRHRVCSRRYLGEKTTSLRHYRLHQCSLAYRWFQLPRIKRIQAQPVKLITFTESSCPSWISRLVPPHHIGIAGLLFTDSKRYTAKAVVWLLPNRTSFVLGHSLLVEVGVVGRWGLSFYLAIVRLELISSYILALSPYSSKLSTHLHLGDFWFPWNNLWCCYRVQ